MNKVWRLPPTKFARQEGFPRFVQFGRFLGIGLLNAAAGYLLFLAFLRLFGLHYLASNVLVLVSWAWFGYELQRRWAFQASQSRTGLPKYVANQVVFAVLGTALLWFLVEILSFRPEIAYVISVGLVTVGIYFASKFWVFGSPRENLLTDDTGDKV